MVVYLIQYSDCCIDYHEVKIILKLTSSLTIHDNIEIL
jgi:hypothetical protein